MTAMPVPQGDYLTAIRHCRTIYTSGMTPRRDGVLIQQGPVRSDAPLSDYSDAVRLACHNALTAVRGNLSPGEAIDAILSMSVFIAAEPGFAAHSRLADIASDFLRTELGDAGIGTRAAIGVASLPGNAPVEITLIAAI